MKFSQIEYKRIDMKALKEQGEALTAQLKNAETFQQADAAFLAVEELLGSTVRSMRTVAQIRREVVRFMMRARVAEQPQAEAGVKNIQENRTSDGEVAKPKTVRKEQTVGRNDPCPCGSGKKYKKCCGMTQK